MRDFARNKESEELSDDDKKAFLEVIQDIESRCKELDLDTTESAAVWAQYKWHTATDHLDVYRFLDAIYMAVVIETSHCHFLKLDPKRSDFYSQLEDEKGTKQFGEKAEMAFPSAKAEIVSACNCFALEQWTASVFHCMRILESPLICLAKQFSVPHDKHDWHNIIEGIEKAVRGIDEKTTGSNWKDEQKYFSEAARHLMFIKNAWRNHVMHKRDEYDEGKALSILQHTRELTIHLAGRISENP